MTGEVTLRGKVLAIGGLPEKAVAAMRAGCHSLIIPRDNEKDMRELPVVIRRNLDIHLVENMDEVLDVALAGDEHRQDRTSSRDAAGDDATPRATH
jgi:ATP-dependent Lon protease